MQELGIHYTNEVEGTHKNYKKDHVSWELPPKRRSKKLTTSANVKYLRKHQTTTKRSCLY